MVWPEFYLVINFTLGEAKGELIIIYALMESETAKKRTPTMKAMTT